MHQTILPGARWYLDASGTALVPEGDPRACILWCGIDDRVDAETFARLTAATEPEPEPEPAERGAQDKAIRRPRRP